MSSRTEGGVHPSLKLPPSLPKHIDFRLRGALICGYQGSHRIKCKDATERIGANRDGRRLSLTSLRRIRGA
jgi:hypothetical protein